MAPRAFWKGYLKLSLVTCPVTMAPATRESGKLRFHTLNARTGNRVVSRYVDAVSGRPVPDEDQARGYPRGETGFVLIDDKELDSIALDSTRTIDIDMFVPARSVGWIWYDTPHYLAPADRIGEEAFLVIREAMAVTGMAGIARLVLYRRERAVMLVPRGKGIVVWTLRYGDEVRDAADYFGDIAPEHPAPAQMALMKRLIGERTRDWDPAMVSDPVQDRLLEIISARKTRQKRPAARPATPPGDSGDKVIDIMEALKRSLAAGTGK